MSRLATGSVFRIRTGKHAGKWAADVIGADGRRHRRMASSAKEAEQHRRTMLANADAGVLQATRQTVTDYVKEWLLYTAKPSVRPSTLEGYSYKLAMLVPLLGSKRLDELEPVHLRRAYTYLLEKGHPAPSERRQVKRNADGTPAGLSPTTVKGAHVVLHRVLRQAYRDGLVRRNVAELVDAPRRAYFEPKPLTRDQAPALIAAVEDHPHGPLWTFMLATGARFGEAAALRWADVDLDERVARIRFTITRPLVRPGVRRWELTPTKTARSRRALALPERVVQALRKQRAVIAELRLKAGGEWHDHDFVFPGATGVPLRNNHNLVAWHRALRAAGLEPRRLHDLRATAATLLFSDGAQARAVSDMLGHSTTAMTDRYIASVPEVARQLSDRMDSLLSVQAGE